MYRRSTLLTLVCLPLITVACGDTPDDPNGPVGVMKTLASSVQNSNGKAFWDALPASYQKELTGVVHEFAKAMPEDVWKEGAGVAKQVVGVLESKRDFIFGHPMLGLAPKAMVEEAKKGWPNIVGMLNTVVGSELTDLNALRSLDLGNFMSSTGSKLLTKIAESAKLSPDNPFEMLEGTTYQLDTSTDTEAIVTATPKNGQPQRIKLKKVDDKWLPAELVDGWASAMTQAKGQLKALPAMTQGPMKEQIMGMMAKVKGAIEKIGKTKNQAQFNAVATQLMSTFRPR